jgi:uncharacterized membrane protein YphA (DoxX/SURF4 family)
MDHNINFWSCVRVAVGLLLAVSGFEKLTGPYQNFQFVIEQYQVIGRNEAAFAAQTLPWVELIGGVFFAFGLWTTAAGAAAVGMFGIFLGVIGQALLRRLPLDDCGCFGDLISIPPPFMFAMDLTLASLTVVGLIKRPGARAFSLDAVYER